MQPTATGGGGVNLSTAGLQRCPVPPIGKGVSCLRAGYSAMSSTVSATEWEGMRSSASVRWSALLASRF